jgi:hypothetical protein
VKFTHASPPLNTPPIYNLPNVICKVLPLGALATLASIAFLASASPAVAGGRAASSCSTKGLSFATGKKASYKVVQLGAEGLTCSKARTVAQQVALDLLHGKPLTLDGVSGLGMSTVSDGSGPAKTQISLTYPQGKITVSLSGSGGSSASINPFPSSPFPSIPSNPFPTPTNPSSGNGHTITV